jgi:hypothetical protein
VKVAKPNQTTFYSAALDRVRQTRLAKDHMIQSVTSVPCFEIWFLLHFRYSTKGYETCQGSICAQVIKDLKQHIPEYVKGICGAYRQIQDRTDDAVSNAKNLSHYNINAETDNPSTKVHELVEYLTTLGNG